MKIVKEALIVGAITLLAACSSPGEGGIDIIDVSGPLDARALRFMADSIERSSERGQVLALVQINSRAVLDGTGYDRLLASVENPPLPVAVWVGPSPASAFGGVVALVEAASHAAIAPGSSWGITHPVVLGEARQATGPTDSRTAEEWAGVEQAPAIYQLLVAYDGREFHTQGGPEVVTTLRDPNDPLTMKRTTFIKPGLVDRFFRLAVIPEAAFFFLVVGLTILVFEFYALGPGVAAGVAGVSLLLIGSGLTVLPTRWWAVGLILVGWLLLTWAHQRGRSVVGTGLGTAAMFLGGLWMIDGQGQIDPRWWFIMLSVLAVLFFYLLAMPTVQRARLSTMTIGRQGLIGMRGTAVSTFTPDGTVEVGGARWRATAHREAGITPGASVEVTGIDGLYLEVSAAGRETSGDQPENVS